MYLYLVDSGEYTKIGITKDMNSRLHTIQTGNPHPCHVARIFDYSGVPTQAVKDLEKRLHTLLRRQHHRGEWFKLHTTTRFVLLNISPSDLLQNKVNLYAA